MVSREFGESSFHIADYAVLVFMLVVSLGIGLYYAFKARKQTSSDEYFRASGTMGIIPAGFSLLASVLCSIWYIGFPTEVYYYGFHFFTDLLFIPVSLGIVSFGILPLFYDLKVTSANEYLERRFNKVVRICGSALYILNSMLYVSLVMFIPALSVSQVTGIHLWLSISLMCVVGTIYTAVGGIRAVMWTDVFQMIIIYSSMVAIVIKGTIDVGGVSTVIDRAIEGGRIKWTPTTLDPRYRYNIYIVVSTSFSYWLGLYGSYQTQVQRYLSCPSRKKAMIALWLNVPAFWLVDIILIYIGLLLYANFAGCDPEKSEAINSMDEILTYYVMTSFKAIPGLPGLFVAGVFSGALSSISSSLNSMAAVTMEDFIVALPCFREMLDETKTKISRWLALGYGLVTLLLMVLVQHLESIIAFYSYNNGAVLGCLSGIFMLGMFVPWANAFGAIAALSLGGGLSFVYVIGSQLSGTEFESESLSIDSCIVDFGNNTFTFFNESSPFFNESSLAIYETTRTAENLSLASIISSSPSIYNEPLYRKPHNSFAFLELFSMSPFLTQSLTFSLMIVLGALFSAIYRIFCYDVVDPKLLSPFVRFWVTKKHVDDIKYHAMDEHPPKPQPEKEEELQTFFPVKFNDSKSEKVDKEYFISRA